LGAAGEAAAGFDAAAGGAGSAAAGVSALGVAAGAGASVDAAGSDGFATAFTALWQDGARLDMFFCRHCNDARPPGGTLEQCAI
jgi:hypothetical protein